MGRQIEVVGVILHDGAVGGLDSGVGFDVLTMSHHSDGVILLQQQFQLRLLELHWRQCFRLMQFVIKLASLPQLLYVIQHQLLRFFVQLCRRGVLKLLDHLSFGLFILYVLHVPVVHVVD